MRRAAARAFGIVLTVTLASACATGPRQPPPGLPEPDKFLFEHGTEALNERKWLSAREYFRQLVDSYPQSTFRADAKLGVGDTFLGEKPAESLVLSANEYREFLTFYPTNAPAPTTRSSSSR
jgi:outer membrane protein assembly factor BamD (BamD/ComL family)